MMKQKGFTLIELLVVIAIIAILAAILFPVFISAKEKANQTACINNLKQMGSAVVMYRGDYNGRFPYWCVEDSKADTHTEWFIKIYSHNAAYPDCTDIRFEGFCVPYMKNRGILYCPAFVGPYKRSKLVSYGYNIHLSQRDIYRPSMGTISESMVPSPSKYIMLMDKDNWWVYSIIYATSSLVYDIRHLGPHDRHSGFCNVAFVDGHVTRMKVAEFWGSVAAEKAHFWNW